MRVLVISDLHEPYSHPDAMRFLARTAKQYRTTHAVCIGDEVDAHAWSRWPKHPKADNAEREIDRARKRLQRLASFGPIKFCESNHARRAYSQLEAAGVPARFARRWPDVIGAPAGWTWASEWQVDGVRYFHGEGYAGAQANRLAALDSRGPVVMGHVHTLAGSVHLATQRGSWWGLSVGCLIDAKHPAFGYGRSHRKRPVLGCGVVLDGVPLFVPMR